MKGVVLNFCAFRCGSLLGFSLDEGRHEAEGHQVVLHVVEPHPVDLAEEVREERAVDHAAGLVLLGLDAPDLLDAGLVGLRVLAVHVEAVDELLGQLPRTPSPSTVTLARMSMPGW